MKIFILDSNADDLKILQDIIYSSRLGILVGKSINILEGLEEILTLEPDLVILDMINEKQDGIHIIKEIRSKNKRINFILISNPKSKELVEKAYESGVEYFIYKPIIKIEVENIVKKLIYRIELEKKMKKIQQIFNELPLADLEMQQIKDCEQGINNILLKLGIMAEKGSEDIFNVVKYIYEKRINIHNITMREICSKFSSNPKSMEQRIRRTIGMALSNIASLGIEDYMNETFVEYSNTLFNFEQVKAEMDYIREKTAEKGSINIKKFLTGISIHCEKFNN